MKSILILIFTCFTVISNPIEKAHFEDSQKCSAELNVEKNRNTKYIYKGEVNFPIILKNTSSNTVTYSLSTKILEDACENSAIKESSKINLDFNVSLQTKNLSNEVILNAGETYNFVVTVTVPEGTPYDNFSCIEVSAKSKDCEDLDANTTIISVYVPNPSEG